MNNGARYRLTFPADGPDAYVGNESVDFVTIFGGAPGAALHPVVSSRGWAVRRKDERGAPRYRLSTANKFCVGVPELWTFEGTALALLAELGRNYGREHLEVLFSLLAMYRLCYRKTLRGDVVAGWLWVPECLAVLGRADTKENRRWWLRCAGVLGRMRVEAADGSGEWHGLVSVAGGVSGSGVAVLVVPSRLLLGVGDAYYWPVNLAAVARGGGVALGLWVLCANQWCAAAGKGRDLVARLRLDALRLRLGVLGQLRGELGQYLAGVRGLSGGGRAVDTRAAAEIVSALDCLVAAGEVSQWHVSGCLGRFGSADVLSVAAGKVHASNDAEALDLPTTGDSLRLWLRDRGITAVGLAAELGLHVRVVRRALARRDLLIGYRLRATIRRCFVVGFPGD